MSLSTSSATLKTDAIALGVAALATALAAAVIFGASFFTDAASPAQQAAELQRNKQEASSLDREVESSHKLLAELTTRGEHSVHLLPANHVNQRLAEITALASESHISISTMTPLQPTPAADTRSLLVGIKLSGTSSYPDLTRFLHTLHDRFRDTALTGLNLAAPPFTPPAPAPSTSDIPHPTSHMPDNSPKAAFTADLTWFCAPPASAASTVSADASAKP